ncbi:hypothetical protein BRC93_04400 [Halobacteriales archaeon QS_5_70_15]|nr:MAG: hypothetical protein BRC93_04400 [Halobacteriales archaeon QS_5_70_15]
MGDPRTEGDESEREPSEDDQHHPPGEVVPVAEPRNPVEGVDGDEVVASASGGHLWVVSAAGIRTLLVAGDESRAPRDGSIRSHEAAVLYRTEATRRTW